MFGPILSFCDEVKKEAEILAAAKKAAISRRSKRLSMPDDTTFDDSTAFESVSTSQSVQRVRTREHSNNLWLISKNESLRAEVTMKVEEKLASVNTNFSTTRTLCIDTAEMAVMRFESNNALGAQISLKKLCPLMIDLARLETIIRKLVSHRVSVETYTNSPERFAGGLRLILQSSERSYQLTTSDTTLSVIPTTERDLEVYLRQGKLLGMIVKLNSSAIAKEAEARSRSSMMIQY
jgi:hypothetical protein